MNLSGGQLNFCTLCTQANCQYLRTISRISFIFSPYLQCRFYTVQTHKTKYRSIINFVASKLACLSQNLLTILIICMLTFPKQKDFIVFTLNSNSLFLSQTKMEIKCKIKIVLDFDCCCRRSTEMEIISFCLRITALLIQIL